MLQCTMALKKRIENEQIISQIVGVSEVCDQCGDRVCTKDKGYHISSIRLKRTFKKI